MRWVVREAEGQSYPAHRGEARPGEGHALMILGGRGDSRASQAGSRSGETLTHGSLGSGNVT